MFEPWSPVRRIDTDRMFEKVAAMRHVLHTLDENAQSVSDEALWDYLRSLLRRRETHGDTWAVTPDLSNVPADARVDFHYTPTYLGTAILAWVFCDRPWLLVRHRDGLDRLRKGLALSTRRGLRGSGYDSLEATVDAVDILARGKVTFLLRRAPWMGPEMAKLLQQVEEGLRESLANPSRVDGWGRDWTPEIQAALANFDRWR